MVDVLDRIKAFASSDLFIGGVVGFYQTAIGHPYDTIKVLYQSGLKINASRLTFRQLYAGFSYPAIKYMITNPCVFNTYYMLNQHYTINSFNAGFLSGLIYSPITLFFDAPKILRQTEEQLLKNSTLTNTIQKNQPTHSSMLSYIIKNGTIFMPGTLMTIVRESVGMGLYFSTYYHMKNELGYNELISGAAAVIMSWTTTYHIDVLKSRQITYGLTLSEAFKMKTTWNNYMRGYIFCITRAILCFPISWL
jgi:hypothetical protein